jgi:hypothetical protein
MTMLEGWYWGSIGARYVQDTETHGNGYTKLFLILHVKIPQHGPRQERKNKVSGSRVC